MSRGGGVSLRQADGHFPAALEGARRGDATAWSTLYHDVAPIIIGYLRAQRLPDPEDVAGEVMLEVVRDLHRFDGDHRGFRSWVLAITHHRLLDARRREQRRPATPTPHAELSSPPAADDPEAETLAAVGFGELEPALQQLTDDQRSVLLLRVIGDLSIREVAEITGKRAGAIKQLQRRAIDTMRRTIDADGGLQPTPAARQPANNARHSPNGRAGRPARDTVASRGAHASGWTH